MAVAISVDDLVDVDELFEAVEDLVALDRPAVPAAVDHALHALAAAHARASGTGPQDELAAAAAAACQTPRQDLPADLPEAGAAPMT